MRVKALGGGSVRMQWTEIQATEETGNRVLCETRS